jgi:hypothetical protein
MLLFGWAYLFMCFNKVGCGCCHGEFFLWLPRYRTWLWGAHCAWLLSLVMLAVICLAETAARHIKASLVRSLR